MSSKREKRSLGVFRNRNYRLLMLANAVNRFGDSVDAIVFTWLTYTLTQQAAFSALIFAANRLPSVLLQPLTGVWMERRPKRRAMVVTDVIRGLLVGYILLRLVTGLPTPAELLGFTLLISTVEAFRQPAGSAILPQIVEREQYADAVSYLSGVSSAAELVGTGMGAMLIGWLGNAGAMAVDVATFFLSALLLSAMVLRGQAPTQAQRFSAGRMVRELGEGVALVRNSRMLLYLILLGVCLNALLVPFNSLQAAMTGEILHGDAQVLSVVGVSLSLGMIVGSALYPAMAARFPLRGILLLASVSLSGMYLGTVAVGRWAPSQGAMYVLIGVLMLVVGVGVALMNNTSMVMTLQNCDQAYLSRVNGLLGSLCSAATPAMSLVVALLANFFSTTALFLASGLFVLAACAVIFSPQVVPKELSKMNKSAQGGVKV